MGLGVQENDPMMLGVELRVYIDRGYRGRSECSFIAALIKDLWRKERQAPLVLLPVASRRTHAFPSKLPPLWSLSNQGRDECELS